MALVTVNRYGKWENYVFLYVHGVVALWPAFSLIKSGKNFLDNVLIVPLIVRFPHDSFFPFLRSIVN